MDPLGPELAPELLAACEANALEIGGTFSRAFDTPMLATVGKAEPLGGAPLPAELSGPGLVVTFSLEGQTAVALLPEAAGVLPAWYGQPDVTGQSKLATLGQELSLLLFPDRLAAEAVGANRAASLAPLLGDEKARAAARYIPLQLSTGMRQGTLYLCWPVAAAPAQPGASASDSTATTAGQAGGSSSASAQSQAPPAGGTSAAQEPITLDHLPQFSRSLLRIEVPVTVMLASKKQPVSRIVELLPGSIIQFNKSCEEMLELEVSGHPVAQGECVKVGDKFGLRVTSLILPGERFEAVRGDG